MVMTAKNFYALEASKFSGKTEAEFFEALKMSNGTFKLTGDGRFSEVEKSLAPIFADRSTDLKTALDVGVSSGITTIQFADSLISAGISVRWTATDLFAKAHIVEMSPFFRVLADPDGWPLQYDLNGLVIRPWIRRLDYVTLSVIPRLLARRYLQPQIRARVSAGQSQPVQLISPRLKNRSDIEFVEDDIFKRNPEFAARYDLVRAANLLNLSYFPIDALRLAIGNLHSYLTGPGAMLLVTRTNLKGENAGTLFELADERTFRIVERIGKGSEIEDLVLASKTD